MHILFDRILKYVLWFVFFVILAAFLYGFAKFDFNFSKYIQYLNNIEVNQLFSSDIENTTGTLLSGDLVDLSGSNDISSGDLREDVFGATGFQFSGENFSGSLDDESYGFVKNSGITGEKVLDSTQAHIVSSGSNDILSGDSKEQLKNLILHEK